MHLTLLILLSVLLPFVWGWGMYWLITRFWPASERDLTKDGGQNHIPSPYDYQI